MKKVLIIVLILMAITITACKKVDGKTNCEKVDEKIKLIENIKSKIKENATEGGTVISTLFVKKQRWTDRDYTIVKTDKGEFKINGTANIPIGMNIKVMKRFIYVTDDESGGECQNYKIYQQHYTN